MAGNARKELETKSGKPVVSGANYLALKSENAEAAIDMEKTVRAIKAPAKVSREGKKKCPVQLPADSIDRARGASSDLPDRSAQPVIAVVASL